MRAEYGRELWSIQDRRHRTYPALSDSRSHDGLLFPHFRPKFSVNFEADTLFTIGSCFARNIEEVLRNRGVWLPTLGFCAPATEWKGRPNGLLNEFNPGTMNQRILFALNNVEFPTETIVPVGELFVDLLLPGGAPVTYERAIERRRQIADVYLNLASSTLLVVTLGLVEAWYDNETCCYLNQMPPHALAEKNSKRFEFRRLGTAEVFDLLSEAFANAVGRGIRVLLTVSPVPLQLSLTGEDCVTANEFSKAVLRVAAQSLASDPLIDYFPSYELVRSGGLSSYMEDHVHPRPEIVERVTTYLLECYLKAAHLHEAEDLI